MSNSERPRAQEIAVIGMACWYPGAQSLLRNWENILGKRRQFRKILDSRLPLAEYHDADRSASDKTYGSLAAYIDGFEFDWMGRRIPKSAYDSTDIVHWLALEVALKAFEDAGLARELIVPRTAGVIVGNSLTGEWSRSQGLRMRWPFVARALRATGEGRGYSKAQLDELISSMEPVFKSLFPPITEDTLAGNLSNTIAGRIANFLDIGGGGYTVDGACSSSLIAVTTAATSLSTGDLDLAVAGGVDISLDTFELIGFSKVGALAKERMRVYDRRSEGFSPGEGCGFVILKRLEDALRDGNQIYALLKGWGLSSDGKGGITAPNRFGQCVAIERAYQRAGYPLSSCQFIEGHGTGTAVGDRTELEGISLAMSQCGEVPARSCGMTSYKSVVGHTKAAAGIGAFIKAVIAVNRRVLPPLAGTEEPSSIFDGVARSLYPILLGEVRSPDETLRAGISAMGFGGINCHVTIMSYGEPSRRLAPSLDERALLVSHEDTEIFPISALTVEKLRARIKDLLEEVAGISEAEMTDLAYEMARNEMPGAKIRAAIVAQSPEQLLQRLRLLQQLLGQPLPEGRILAFEDQCVWVCNSLSKKRIAFLFPGQGSQRLNMGREIHERFPWARQLMASAGRWLASTPAARLESLMFRPIDRALDAREMERWSKELAQTEIAQPAICLTSLLWMRRLMDLGIFPCLTAGHSLGELTAFHCAGAFDEESLLRLAGVRGELMSAPADKAGAMAKLSCTAQEAEELVSAASAYVTVANINAPDQVVVSGSHEGVEEVVGAASRRGYACQKLNVSNAFHSQLVSSAAEKMRSQGPIHGQLRKLALPLHSCMNGERIQPGVDLKEYFAAQISHRVNFVELVRSVAKSCDLMIEVGPGQVLSNLVTRIAGESGPRCLPVEVQPGRQMAFKKAVAVAYIHGVEIRWEELFRNRLVRPYVPPSKRLFIDNPCERPFPEGVLPARSGPTEPLRAEAAAPGPTIVPFRQKRSVVQGAEGQVSGALLRIISEKTGFSGDAIRMEMRLLDDLNLDSIKAGEIIASLGREFSITAQFDPAQFANATLRDVVDAISRMQPAVRANESVGRDDQLPVAVNAPAPQLQQISGGRPKERALRLLSPEAAPAKGEDEVRDALFRLILEKTGFSADAIRMEMRLLDDLNLDSIKAGEIIAALVRELSIAVPLDPMRFANATLQDIVSAVDRAKAEQGRPSPVTAPGESHTKSTPEEILFAKIEQVTGFGRSSLSPELRLLDDLNLDSIKAAEILAASGRELGIQGSVDPSALANASLREIIEAFGKLAGSVKPDAILALLVTATSEASGFPPDSIGPATRLAADLNLSRRRIWEIVKRVAGETAVDPRLDIDVIIGYPLQEIARIIKSVQESQAVKLIQPIAQTELSTLSARPTWTRNFFVSYEVCEKPSDEHRFAIRQIDKWPLASVLIVAEAESAELTAALEAEVRRLGGKSDIISYDKLISSRLLRDSAFSYILAVLPPEASRKGLDPARLLKLTIERLGAVVAPAQASEAPRRQTTLALVQTGGGYFGEGPVRTPEFCGSGVKAIAEALHMERPDLRVRVLDISRGAELSLLTAKILEELNTPEPFAAVGFDEKLTRRVPRLRLQQPGSYRKRNIAWLAEDVVLVTGGAKGITAECALAFARRHGVRLALVGSSPLSRDPADEMGRNLARLAAEKISYRYFQCDLTDAQAVRQLVQSVTEQMGPVRGVIHGAGLNKPRRMEQTSPESAFDEVAPKVLGAVHLFSALEGTELKLFAALTSIIGVTGVIGNGWYGFSNEVLNLAVRKFRELHPKTETVTLAYGMWDEVGMAIRLGSGKRFEKLGVALIPKQEAVRRFLLLTESDPGVHQVVVTARMWPNSLLRFPDGEHSPGFRFVEKVVAYTPGVELLARAELSLEKDLYLRDHRYKGSYLLPTVFGLEAMAEAALQVTGRKELHGVCFEDVALERPIVVDPRNGARIEIHAEALEKPDQAAGTRVRVGIRAEQTGYQRDHFSAVVLMDSPMDRKTAGFSLEGAALKLKPGQDFYKWLLFHGPKYQRFSGFHALDSKSSVFRVRVEESAFNEGESFAQPVSKPLVLGDPFYRDALLQAGQVVTMGTRSLPIRVKRWEILELPAAAGERIARFAIEKSEPGYWNSSVEVAASDGRVVERLTGFESKILERKPDDPSPEQVYERAEDSGSDSDLASRLMAHRSIFGGRCPVLVLSRIAGLGEMKIDRRHEAELPLIKSGLARFFEGRGRRDPGSQVRWLSAGKPVVAGAGEAPRISLSHVGDFCIVAVDESPIGCDIEIIRSRDEQEWISLLGPRRAGLYRELVAAGQSPDAAGTSVWSMAEAFGKAIDSVDFEIDGFRIEKDAISFSGRDGHHQPLRGISFAMKLPSEESCVVSVAVKEPSGGGTGPEGGSSVELVYPTEEIYTLKMTEANRFIARWPVSFRDAASPGRGIYFTQFFKWQGQVRELAMWPVSREVTARFGDGAFAMVTNSSKTRYLGEAGINDVIEVQFWLKETPGKEANTIDTFYDWRRIAPDGTIERVAFSEMQISWVKVKGHGIVELAPFPDEFKTVLERISQTHAPESLPESFAAFSKGEAILIVPPSSISGPELARRSFLTSLEESNLVGNIYFANYSAWQGRVRDGLFHDLLGKGAAEPGELVCASSATRHLREAMPFDTIEVVMTLRELRSNFVKLQFDYYRVDDGRKREKIAVGEHEAYWMTKSPTGGFSPSPLPQAVVYQLLKAAAP